MSLRLSGKAEKEDVEIWHLGGGGRGGKLILAGVFPEGKLQQDGL